MQATTEMPPKTDPRVVQRFGELVGLGRAQPEATRAVAFTRMWKAG